MTLGVPEDFWSREQVCAALRKRDMGSLFRLLKKYVGASQSQIGAAVGLEQGYVSKIMNGRRSVTAIDLLDRIATGCTMPDACRMLLGLAPRVALWLPGLPTGEGVGALADVWPDRHSSIPMTGRIPVGDVAEWPAWFGVRLARIIAVLDDWQAQCTQSEALQSLLHQEVLMFDAAAQGGDHPAHALSRRQALATLAALPVTFATSGPGARGAAAATEYFLGRCAASLTACWHMLKGSDLSTVDRTLSAYLLELEGIAQRRSPYQDTAARLASQAHRICGIIALHRNQLSMREHHCRRALHYAMGTSDIASRVSALISLASTYFYDANPARSAAVYEQALTFLPAMSPLQRSRVHAELSVVYGQLGREKESLRSVALAEQLYPGDPEHDSSYLYAEFTRASLTLERGLSYVALADRYPGREYQQIAADIFARVEKAPAATVPDRIRYEIVNHQARTAVLLRDIDAFELYMSRGVDGVVRLGSRQRCKEMRATWQRATEAWPRERRLRGLRERLRPALSGPPNVPVAIAEGTP